MFLSPSQSLHVRPGAALIGFLREELLKIFGKATFCSHNASTAIDSPLLLHAQSSHSYALCFADGLEDYIALRKTLAHTFVRIVNSPAMNILLPIKAEVLLNN